MLIAGETSGDLLAAELVHEIRQLHPGVFAPKFFGAGGPKMAQAGVELEIDMTQHTAFGLAEVLGHYFKFRRMFHQLLNSAIAQQPDILILTDYSGFNLRFARAIKRHVTHRQRVFDNWKPKIAYYVSPQVWASRERRVHDIARDIDLVLSIIRFEKAWYAERAPDLRVEYVGDPLAERFGQAPRPSTAKLSSKPLVLLLPGSRTQELRRHLPIVASTVKQLSSMDQLRFRAILPNAEKAVLARQILKDTMPVELQVGGLKESLGEAALAIASSGTVTRECAYAMVPTVVLYRVARLTYEIGKRLVRVPYIAMPNLLAQKEIFPEFIQDKATPDRIAQAARQLLFDTTRRSETLAELENLRTARGEPGAARRAAQAILSFDREHRALALGRTALSESQT